jgi:hypothetical protein
MGIGEAPQRLGMLARSCHCITERRPALPQLGERPERGIHALVRRACSHGEQPGAIRHAMAQPHRCRIHVRMKAHRIRPERNHADGNIHAHFTSQGPRLVARPLAHGHQYRR